MLSGEDDDTGCQGTLLSGQEVDDPHHSVDHLPKSRPANKKKLFFSVFWAVNGARVWSLAYFQRAGPVPGPHQVCSPTVLPGDEVMEWNSGFPDIKSNISTMGNNRTKFESNVFYLYIYMQYFLSRFYLCHVVKVLRWVEMPRPSIWCKLIPASITDITHITNTLDKQIYVYTYMWTRPVISLNTPHEFNVF